MITSRQIECQRFILKIHSERLRKAKWKLTLPLDVARRNDEVISLASSQVLRWIDELNGVVDADVRAREIKREIRALKKEPASASNRKSVRKLYEELDAIQFKPDYMCLIIDKLSDYRRACKGFSINGVKYHRLLGTTGGIKCSTIVFVSERLYTELMRRIENGRNPDKPIVPAKLEAYRALTCSASIPVSMPHGILVVDDAETTFKDLSIDLSDNAGGEPIMSEPYMKEVTLTISDGCGMMLPSLAERWSAEIGLDYVAGGFCTRNAWEKGMVYTFPFDEFAAEVAHRYIVKDAWGNDVDIREVELVLPVSMLKLWNSYDSLSAYLANCDDNGYTFGITKACPERLENTRNLNYQFIQSYDLSDDDIEELIAPTVQEIHDVLQYDWRKTVLFLKGAGLNEKNAPKLENDFAKALMIDQSLIDDPYVRGTVYRRIQNRINEAKIGVLSVHGNYSIACGDLYGLCQSIFGLPVTGLLKAGEIWNGYWAETGAEQLVCFRAPMSCHENIRRVVPARNDEVRRWFRYMQTCTVVSAWSNEMAACNGMDFDGDLLMLTDNDVLVRNHKVLPTLCCGQGTAAKIVPAEEDIINANIASFGNEVGQITNRVTAMYDVRSQFDSDSEEYSTLQYRIQCGQKYQQDSIDKAKGIVTFPMPRYWYDKRSIGKEVPESNQDFCRSIVADRKPYFMRYVYPNIMRDYNTYIKTTNKNAMREFAKTIDELMATEFDNLTQREVEFLYYYNACMPVLTGNGVMNRICRRIEREFDGYLSAVSKASEFDYSVMRSEAEYSKSQYSAVSNLITTYNKRLRDYQVFASIERIDEDDFLGELSVMEDDFRVECEKICPNEDVLCNIVLDICYGTEKGKRFAWKVSGNVMVRNLLKRNGYIMNVPTLDDAGEIQYAGDTYSIVTVELQKDDET